MQKHVSDNTTIRKDDDYLSDLPENVSSNVDVIYDEDDHEILEEEQEEINTVDVPHYVFKVCIMLW